MNSPTPRLRLDFYRESVILSRWEEDGRVIVHPVAAGDVAAACSSVPAASGLLPPNTLFWKQVGDRPVIGIYVPGRRWRVRTAERAYHVPFPPLVFVGQATQYRVFAVKKRPVDLNEPLYHAPCPNVHADGRICPGETRFPVCGPATIHDALALFLEGSLFNGDLGGGKCRRLSEDVRQLWERLQEKRRFPASELVACGTVGSRLL